MSIIQTQTKKWISFEADFMENGRCYQVIKHNAQCNVSFQEMETFLNEMGITKNLVYVFCKVKGSEKHTYFV